MRKIYQDICGKCINIKILEYHISLKKYQLFLLFGASAKIKIKKYLKKEESIEILNILSLIKNI